MVRGNFILLVGVFFLSCGAYAGELVIDVSLSPAGSYKAKTAQVTGFAKKSGSGKVIAQDVVIDMSSLTTGIELRDKHTKERLRVKEFPKARLVSATGQDGKGHATIEAMGKKVEVNGTYEVSGQNLVAHFPLQISTFGIQSVRYMGVGVKDKVMVNVTLPIH